MLSLVLKTKTGKVYFCILYSILLVVTGDHVGKFDNFHFATCNIGYSQFRHGPKAAHLNIT